LKKLFSRFCSDGSSFNALIVAHAVTGLDFIQMGLNFGGVAHAVILYASCRHSACESQHKLIRAR